MNKAKLILNNKLLYAILAVFEPKQLILTHFLELLRAEIVAYVKILKYILDNESPVHKIVNMLLPINSNVCFQCSLRRFF